MSDIKAIGRLFTKRINLSANKDAIGWLDHENLKFINYLEYKNIIEQLAVALNHLGLQIGDKVSLLSSTRKEWHYLDLSILCSRGIVVPIYPSYPASDIYHIIKHSDSSILIVENEVHFQKCKDLFTGSSQIKLIISLDEISEELKKEVRNLIPFYSYKELLQIGSDEIKSTPDFLTNRIQAQKEDDIATIIYTSGTTGEPKGAVIKQEALYQMLVNVKDFVQGGFGENDRTLTFLPLSHVLGRCDSLLLLIFGWQMVFARSMETIVSDLKIVRPTVMVAVPRIFEKIYSKITDEVEKANLLNKGGFELAIYSAKKYFEKIDVDRSPNALELIGFKIAQEVVFQKVKEGFGGKIRYFVSGGAPLSPPIIEFLRYAGLTILEGYGLTETVAPCSLNPLSRQRVGTVGRPIGDVSFRFADDGEILIRSKAMFSEYYKNPIETEKSFHEGWFASGDIGHFTTDGYLKITDRKKDIIITSGGKNVAPQKIENILKSQKYISHALVIGDQKKFLTALIGIEKERFIDHIQEWGLALDIGVEELSQDFRVKELIQQNIDATNQGLAQFETIKNYFIVPEVWTLENYITPSLKVKRKPLLEKYHQAIEAMYQT